MSHWQRRTSDVVTASAHDSFWFSDCFGSSVGRRSFLVTWNSCENLCFLFWEEVKNYHHHQCGKRSLFCVEFAVPSAHKFSPSQHTEGQLLTKITRKVWIWKFTIVSLWRTGDLFMIRWDQLQAPDRFFFCCEQIGAEVVHRGHFKSLTS